MQSNAAVAVVLLLAAGTAGCSGGKDAAEPEEQVFEGLGLQATAETGVVRGVVIDEAIRPVAGVLLGLSGPAGPAGNMTSNAEGAFGMDGLDAGTYFLKASKAGYQPVQVSVEVVAGVSEPAIVKVLLPIDPASLPYYDSYVMDGYITCSARIALTAVPGGECLASDTSQVVYTLDRVPDWIQSEMHWQSTQALGDALSLVSECFSGIASEPDPCPDGNLVVNRSEGSSPRSITVNRTLAARFRVGDGETGNPHRLRVFAAGRADTDLIDEDAYNQMLNETTGGLVPCVAWPAINDGCFRFTGVGVILNQAFSVYTNIFYGYTPPPGWSFVATGEVPQPQ